MKKSKAAVILAVILAAFVGLAYYASIILSSTGIGEDMSIPLGLDLSGGVSITYQVVDENPSTEDMKDTIYKLQKRVDSYSTEAVSYTHLNGSSREHRKHRRGAGSSACTI